MSTYISYETETVLDIPDVEELIKKVVDTALTYENCPFKAEVNVTVSDDEEVHRINREFRGIDKTTDVLSFPSLEFDEPGNFEPFEVIEENDPDNAGVDEIYLQEDIFCAEAGTAGIFNHDTGEIMLGDMIISAQRVKAQAFEYGHSELRELAFLVAHSMFHLFGYDHEDPEEAKIMEAKQEDVLKKIGIER